MPKKLVFISAETYDTCIHKALVSCDKSFDLEKAEADFKKLFKIVDHDPGLPYGQARHKMQRNRQEIKKFKKKPSERGYFVDWMVSEGMVEIVKYHHYSIDCETHDSLVH